MIARQWDRLGDIAASVGNWVGSAKGARLTLAALLIASSLAAMYQVRNKPFWFDEVVTVEISSLATIADVWTALEAGADAQPLSYHLLARAAGKLPIDPHISFRLPSIAGYLIATIAIFAIVTSKLGPTTGLLAALLLMSSHLRGNGAALEARPYGFLVGSVAVAAWAWTNLERWRGAPFILAAALVGASASHHYGVVSVFCVGLAETAVLLSERRWRWRAWAAAAAGLTPLAISIPLLLRFRAVFGATFWSPATLDQIPATYLSLATIRGATTAFAIGFAWLLVTHSWQSEDASPGWRAASEPLSVGWVILIAALILYPVWIVVPTTLVHGGYAPRYAMPCVLGLSIGMSFALSRTLIQPALRALVVALIATVGWHEATTATGLVRHPGPPETPVDRLNARFLKYDASMPVVISSGIDYLPIAHYGRNATHQYVLLVKPDAALSWMGTDSVDINSLVLQRFLRLHVADADTFVRDHPRFYIFASRNNFAWIQRYFASSSTVHLSLLEYDDSASIYLAESLSRGR